jgi:hypothetical protein
MMSEELLNRSVDGELRPEDQRRLERLLTEDPAAVERLSDLHRVSEWLGELGYEDPPASLVGNVMRQVRGLAAQRQGGNVTAVRFGGIPIRRQILFGLAAAAALVLAVFAVTGYPPVQRGAAGTIGAAKLEDTLAQQFVQSDTFARLVKDPAAVRALSDPAVAQYFKDDGIVRYLKDSAVVAAVRDLQTAAAMQDAQFAAALRDQAFVAAIRDSSLRAALQNEAFAAALTDASFVGALRSDALHQAVKSDGFAAAIKDPNFAAALGAALRQ